MNERDIIYTYMFPSPFIRVYVGVVLLRNLISRNEMKNKD